MLKRKKNVEKEENAGNHHFLFLSTIFSALTQTEVVTFSIFAVYDIEKEDFRKYFFSKRRKCWLPTFSPFPTIFSAMIQTEVVTFSTFYFRLKKKGTVKGDFSKYCGKGRRCW